MMIMIMLNIIANTMKVLFVGESGVDTGGPSREFWWLFGTGIAASYCVANDKGQSQVH